MKICFYTDYAISGMTGGIGRATSVLAQYFSQNYNWKIYSIYAFDAPNDCLLYQTNGSIRIRLHDRLGIRKLHRNYKHAANFIISNKIDIVIIQTSMDVVAKLRSELDIQKATQVKIVSVLHYSPGTDEFPIKTKGILSSIINREISGKDLLKSIIAPIYNKWEHIATQKAYKNAYIHGNMVYLLSETYIPEFKNYAQLAECSKLKAIPNCIPFDQEFSHTQIEQKEKIAIIVGRMVDFPKRISLLLEMWKTIELDPAGKEWQLKIIGDGPDLDSFKKKAKKLELKHCFFLGRQNPIEYYSRASIFLMTSLFEGFPMTLIEAQQMGCIPIAFNSFRSIHDVITDNINGCLVPDGDKKNFILKTLFLMNDDLCRKKMARQAIIDSKRYSQQTICEIWANELNRLVDSIG